MLYSNVTSNSTDITIDGKYYGTASADTDVAMDTLDAFLQWVENGRNFYVTYSSLAGEGYEFSICEIFGKLYALYNTNAGKPKTVLISNNADATLMEMAEDFITEFGKEIHLWVNWGDFYSFGRHYLDSREKQMTERFYRLQCLLPKELFSTTV